MQNILELIEVGIVWQSDLKTFGNYESVLRKPKPGFNKNIFLSTNMSDSL